MNFLRVFRQGLRVGVRDFSVFWTWKSWLGGWMVRILTNVMLWVLMGRLLASPARLHYLLIGNAATAGVGTFAIVVATWERYDGTFPLLVAAPSPLAPAVMGRMSVWMFGWIASALLTFFLLALYFDFRTSWQAVATIPFIILLLCVSTFFFSAFLGALIAAAPKFRLIFAWLLLTVLTAFCGVNVPVAFWPPWVQFIANLLPVTHGLEAVRLILDHGWSLQVLRDLLWETLVGLGWLLLALAAFSRSANSARADGSIEFV